MDRINARNDPSAVDTWLQLYVCLALLFSPRLGSCRSKVSERCVNEVVQPLDIRSHGPTRGLPVSSPRPESIAHYFVQLTVSNEWFPTVSTGTD